MKKLFLILPLAFVLSGCGRVASEIAFGVLFGLCGMEIKDREEDCDRRDRRDRGRHHRSKSDGEWYRDTIRRHRKFCRDHTLLPDYSPYTDPSA